MDWRLLALLCVAFAVGCGEGAGDEAPADAAPDPDVGRTILDSATVESADAQRRTADAATDAAPDTDALDPDAAPLAACANGRDDDGDGRADFPTDPGCADAADDDEADPAPTPQCDDGLDNDEDGLLDLADPDCGAADDPVERGANGPTVCANGADDDGDGRADFPYDPGCPAAGHNSEVDVAPPPACADGADDDGDGRADFPADPGCQGAGDADEADPDPAPACANGADDDGNGDIDWPEDTGCDAAGDGTESSPCGEATLVDLNRHLADHEHYDGDLTGAASRLLGTCGGAAGGEVVFRYRVDRPLDRLVFDTRHPETEAPVVMYLRRDCLGEEAQCTRGLDDDPGAAITVEAPPPGLYFLVVDTGSRMRVGRFRLTANAVEPPHCRNGADDDADGLTDLADPGCTGTEDADEADPDEPPVCLNGADDDDDGRIDWPDDPDCPAAGWHEEQPPCALNAPLARVGQQGGEVALAVVQGPGVAQGRCEASLGAETVVVLTLTEPSDVDFQVLSPDGLPLQVSLHARTDCANPQAEIGCRAAARFESALTLTNLDRGTYFLFAEQGLTPPPGGLVARVAVRSNLAACNDLADNDLDGLVDVADPGCAEGRDDDERDPPMPPQCSDGVDNDGNGLTDWPDDEGCAAAGDPEETPDCTGTLYGDVCVVHLSAQCVNGSAIAYCQMNGGEVATFAEFQAIVAAGWVRPNGSYHTMAVAEYPMCADGFGNVGIPGWGQFNLHLCGENTNYCNRSILCVTR